jgi:hypothetical protein
MNEDEVREALAIGRAHDEELVTLRPELVRKFRSF